MELLDLCPSAQHCCLFPFCNARYADIADLERHVKIHPDSAKDIQNIFSGGRSTTNPSATLSGAQAGYASSHPATGAGTSSASTTSMQLNAKTSTPGDGLTSQVLTNGAQTGTPGTSQNTSSAAVARHVCAICNKTFGRASDLNRHAAKHDTNARRHDCLIGSCRYRGSEGFYRRDKLLAHQRAVHGYTL